MNVQPGQLIAQRYRLARELGRGGVGSVWLAHHIANNTPCAIKFFIGPDEDLEQYTKRFEFEAQAAAQLQHPNVIRIYDSGIWEGRPFIVMEHLEGECLDERLRRRKRLVPTETIAFCTQVGQALAAAHAVGIVHRDLKPGNIFLAQMQGRIVVKLIDFGIAKASTFSAAPSPLTHTETIIGTPSYMSPEQIEGTRPLDGRSDLWSLGVIAFECLTGKLPFDSTTVGELFSKIMFKPIPMPSQVFVGLPPALDGWWARASAREVEKRFQSASELCEALSRALLGNPMVEGDPTWWTATGNVMPLMNRSMPPTLSGQSRPQAPEGRTRSGLLLAGALFGSAVVIAGILLIALLRRSHDPPPETKLATTASAPVSTGSAAAVPVATTPPAPPTTSAEPLPEPSGSAAATSPSAPASASPRPVPSYRPNPKTKFKGPRPAATWGF